MVAALDAAVEVFWGQGYEGSSLADLTDAMRINRPSLYAAFGNKEQLFLAAIARYRATRLAYVDDALVADHAVTAYLTAHVNALTLPGTPPGCLLVTGGLATSASNAWVGVALTDARRTIEDRIAERLDRPSARLLMTVGNGLAVDAAAGASRKRLTRTADLALVHLCTPKSS